MACAGGSAARIGRGVSPSCDIAGGTSRAVRQSHKSRTNEEAFAGSGWANSARAGTGCARESRDSPRPDPNMARAFPAGGLGWHKGRGGFAVRFASLRNPIASRCAGSGPGSGGGDDSRTAGSGHRARRNERGAVSPSEAIRVSWLGGDRCVGGTTPLDVRSGRPCRYRRPDCRAGCRPSGVPAGHARFCSGRPPSH